MGLFSFLFGQRSSAPRASSVLSCPHCSSYVILDTETTGLNPSSDRIIQISAIRYDPDGVPVDRYNTYVNPGIPIPARATSINGITNRMVSVAPSIERIRDKFFAFLDDSLIVGYNANFDLKFLRFAFCEDFSDWRYVDALEVARSTLSMPDYKLESVATRIGFAPRGAYHDAFTDCEAVAAILRHIGEDLNCWVKIFEPALYRDYQSGGSGGMIPLDDKQAREGHKLWTQGENERIDGNIEDALRLYDKARDVGYKYPYIYESYAKAYRKLKDYENEIRVLDEAIQTFDGPDAQVFVTRRARVDELIAAQEKREAAALQKALERERKAEARRREKEEEVARPKKSVGRPVAQCDDNGAVIREFETVASAAQSLGISAKCIRDAACGRQKHAAGYCWKYISPDIPDGE